MSLNTRLLAIATLSVSLSLSGCGKPETATSASASTQSTASPATLSIDEATARPVINHYSDMALAIFSDALTQAQQLQAAVDALVKSPNEANLQAARSAWLAARIPYMQSEVLRFGNSVVDDWEGQMNAWPLDEGLIDYVAGDYQFAMGNPGATANIIANKTLKVGEKTLDLTTITPELLASLNELGGSEANVATGYHAIEFLLWGQDLNGTKVGAGNRPYTDFVVGKKCTGNNCERRAQYLQAVTQLLVTNLQDMVAQWQPNADNYRTALAKETAEQGVRKMFFGMGSLSLGELAGERMKVSLEANSTEDEHDCFSDNTHNSQFFDAKGVRNIYLGEYKRIDGSVLVGPSLSSLVKTRDAKTDSELQAKLAATEQALQVIVDKANAGEHFDQLIASDNAAGNQLVQQGINALVAQTTAIESAARALGIQNLNPDTADHAF